MKAECDFDPRSTRCLDFPTGQICQRAVIAADELVACPTKLCTDDVGDTASHGVLSDPAWSLSCGADAKSDIVRVAVYRGPASCEDCSETAKKAIEDLGYRYHVDLIGVREITPETLSRYDVYVQPGGGQDIPGPLESFGEERVEAIRHYVAAGGKYLGLCMGAYLASGSGIGLIPHELDSEVGRAGFPVNTIESTAITSGTGDARRFSTRTARTC